MSDIFKSNTNVEVTEKEMNTDKGKKLFAKGMKQVDDVFNEFKKSGGLLLYANKDGVMASISNLKRIDAMITCKVAELKLVELQRELITPKK